MSWIQFGGLLVSILSTFGFLWREIKSLEDKISQESKRTDMLYQTFTEGMERQDKRIDKLYQMFVDLLKERKI